MSILGVSTSTQSPVTPNEELARRIAERLATAAMIASTDAGALAARLAAGTLRQADWEQMIEAAPSPPPAGGPWDPA